MVKVLLFGFSVTEDRNGYSDWIIKKAKLSKEEINIIVCGVGGLNPLPLATLYEQLHASKGPFDYVFLEISTSIYGTKVVDWEFSVLDLLYDVISRIQKLGAQTAFINLYRDDFDYSYHVFDMILESLSLRFDIPLLDLAARLKRLRGEKFCRSLLRDVVHTNHSGSEFQGSSISDFISETVWRRRRNKPVPAPKRIARVVRFSDAAVGPELEQFSRAGLDLILVRIEAGKSCTINIPDGAILYGISYISGPLAGDLVIQFSNDGNSLVVSAFDEHSYYPRYNLRRFEERRGCQSVTVTQTEQMPVVQPLKGVPDTSPRVGLLAALHYFEPVSERDEQQGLKLQKLLDATPAAEHSGPIALNLGPAWSANTVNTVIFRREAVLTAGRFQFCAFYADSSRLRIVQRDLASGSLFSADIHGDYNLVDAHNSISLAIDRDGYIHLAYDSHATQLRYRRSENALSIHAWTDELPMSGHREGRVTYPTFLMQSSNQPLLVLYRDGGAESGSAWIKEYSEATQTWHDRELPVLSGTQQQPWTSNAYWNQPVIGRDGVLHLTFVWRTHLLGKEKRVNNINIGYARSADQGRRWFSSRGQQFRLPITQVNAETVWPVSPGSNLINQCGMALDSQGFPHVAFYSDDSMGVPQYQHLWFDGQTWMHSFISARTQPFLLTGGGTLKIPMSRPEIVIDDDDVAYVIYRGDLTGDRLVAQRLQPPAYDPDPVDIRVLWEAPVGFAEPVIDRSRWRRDGVLTMLVQKNRQPAHDAPSDPTLDPIYLVDWRLNLLWK
jgi:BNR repeat-containing family member